MSWIGVGEGEGKLSLLAANQSNIAAGGGQGGQVGCVMVGWGC